MSVKLRPLKYNSAEGPARRAKIVQRFHKRGYATAKFLVDPYIREYWNYLSDTSEKERDPKLFADVAQAAQLRDDRMTKIKLEARIVSGQDDEEVAHGIGITPDVARAYRKLFLDTFGQRLTLTIVGSHLTKNIHGNSDALQKVVILRAHAIGPVYIDEFLDQIDMLGREHDLSTPHGRRLEKLELLVRGLELKTLDPKRYHKTFSDYSLTRPETPPTPPTLDEIFTEAFERSTGYLLPEDSVVA